MPTKRPRYSLTLDSDLLDRINHYKFQSKSPVRGTTARPPAIAEGLDKNKMASGIRLV